MSEGLFKANHNSGAGNKRLLPVCCWVASRPSSSSGSSGIIAGIKSLSCLDTTGAEGSVVLARKGFGLTSKGKPSIGGVKSNRSASRFCFLCYTPVCLCLHCTSCSGLSTSNDWLAYCNVKVCWPLVLLELDSTLECVVKFEILKKVKLKLGERNQ